MLQNQREHTSLCRPHCTQQRFPYLCQYDVPCALSRTYLRYQEIRPYCQYLQPLHDTWQMSHHVDNKSVLTSSKKLLRSDVQHARPLFRCTSDRQKNYDTCSVLCTIRPRSLPQACHTVLPTVVLRIMGSAHAVAHMSNFI